MEIQPPQERKCNECGRTYSLNLFSRDKESCRYCETGNIPPKEGLVKNIKDSQTWSLNTKDKNDIKYFKNIINSVFEFAEKEIINNNELASRQLASAIYYLCCAIFLDQESRYCNRSSYKCLCKRVK